MAAFALCERLGIPHPSRLGEHPYNLTAAEFNDWLAYMVQQSDPKKYKPLQSPKEMQAVLRQAIGLASGKRSKPDDRHSG